MKLVITAGGGGHFAPVLPILNALPKETQVLVIGRKYAFEGDSARSLEYQIAESLGISFKHLTTGRLQRRFTRHTVPSLFRLPIGLWQALQLLRQYQPDVVLSFGGYVALPVVVAASLLKIPIVLHEQTQEAGAANRLSSKFAKKICLSWPSSQKFFPKEKIVMTGTPLREEILRSSDSQLKVELIFQKNTTLPLIYITGGSLGAHAINILIEEKLAQLLKKYRIFHQTGDATRYQDFDRLKDLVETLSEDLQERYLVTKFVNPKDTGFLLKEATLVIGRSGINTVTELLYLGKPALLIPLPISQKQEQLKNAMLMKSVGLGQILEQNKASGQQLQEAIHSMVENIENYKKHILQANALVKKDAAQRIIAEVMACVAKK